MKHYNPRYVQARGIVLTVAVFLVMILAVVFALNQLGQQSGSEQTKSLEDAVLRATLTCYAVEGRYPMSIEYLVKHYGIVYNDEKYMISLDSFAQNLLPSIQVLVIGEEGWL